MKRIISIILAFLTIFTLCEFSDIGTVFAAEPIFKLVTHCDGTRTEYNLTKTDTEVMDRIVTTYNKEDLQIAKTSKITVEKNGIVDSEYPYDLMPGNYQVIYTPNLYNGSGVIAVNRIAPANIDYYVLSSTTGYEKELNNNDKDYNKMRYNAKQADYDEYILEEVPISFEDQDFYILKEKNNGDSPPIIIDTENIKNKGSNFEYNYIGRYTVYYSPNHMYSGDLPVKVEWVGKVVHNETIEIYNENDYIDFAEMCVYDEYSLGKKVTLYADLNFDSIEFTPISYFSGTFDGNGHSINNAQIKGKGSYAGLFRYIGKNGIVKDLSVKNVVKYDETQKYIGGICGSNCGKIENCEIHGDVLGEESIGGVVGLNSYIEEEINGKTVRTYGEIINCRNYAEIEGYGNIGGICGCNKGIIRSCKNYGIINSVDYLPSKERNVLGIGGIAGFDGGKKIVNCENHSVIGYDQIGSFIGGIVGVGLGNIYECTNLGNVRGRQFVGGIMGYNANFTEKSEYSQLTSIPYVSKLISMNNIGASNDNGLPLNIQDAFNNSPNIDEILKDENIYDIFPDSRNGEKVESVLKYCCNEGRVMGVEFVGGIVGYISNGQTALTSINGSYNTGIIISKKGIVGGIVGKHNSGKIDSNYNLGEIRITKGDNIGGIAGISNGEISSCYAICDLLGDGFVGGIVGKGNHISSCYSNCIIKANGENIGAIAGTTNGRATFNYFINTEFGGIDNISYQRFATKLEPLEMCSSNGVLPQKMAGFKGEYWIAGKDKKHYPELAIFSDETYEFEDEKLKNKLLDYSKSSTLLSYRLQFVDENNEEVLRVLLNEGESFEDKKIPEVPKKEGYYGNWSKFSQSQIKNDQRIEPVYVKELTALVSDSGSGSEVIIVGHFHPNTVLYYNRILLREPVLLDGYKQNSIYEFSASLDEKKLNLKNTKVKLRVTSGFDNPKVAKVVGDGFEIVECKLDGTHIEFTYDGISQYSVVYNMNYFSRESLKLILMSAAGGIALTLLATIVISRFRKRNRLI